MDNKRLQELNALLVSNKFDKAAYDKLPLEDTYAMFRLATIHHATLTKTIKEGKLKNQSQKAQEDALKILLGKANFFYAASIERIKKMSCFYVAYSMLTNMPFVYCDPKNYNDLVWVFTSEEKLNAVIEKQKESNVPMRCQKIENSDFLKFFSKLFYMGIDHLIFDYGTDGMVFTLENICKKPQFDKIENPAMALHNPSLTLSTLYFLQEARKQIPQNEKKDLPQLEEEMSKNIVEASYLMPFVKPEEGQENIPSNYKIPYYKNDKGETILPVFTDLMEFDKYNKDHKFSAVLINYEKFTTFMGGGNGIIINPTSFGLYLKKELLPILKKRFED